MKVRWEDNSKLMFENYMSLFRRFLMAEAEKVAKEKGKEMVDDKILFEAVDNISEENFKKLATRFYQ